MMQNNLKSNPTLIYLTRMAEMSKSVRTNFRINETLSKLLSILVDKFGSQSRAITIVADRYLALIFAERRNLQSFFSALELMLIFSIYEGVDFKSASIVIDTFIDHIMESDLLYSLSDETARSGFIKKVKILTPGQILGLVDMIEELRNPVDVS